MATVYKTKKMSDVLKAKQIADLKTLVPSVKTFFEGPFKTFFEEWTSVTDVFDYHSIGHTWTHEEICSVPLLYNLREYDDAIEKLHDILPAFLNDFDKSILLKK